MGRLKIIILISALAGALVAQPAYAHGFGERYDLPVPVGYFFVGAGAAVVLSFVIIGLFLRSGSGQGGYPRYNLFQHRWLRLALTSHLLLVPIKILSVFLLGLVIATGLFGTGTESLNFAPTFVWIIWWVGLGFVSALLGNLWALLNPWKIIFEWVEALFALIRPGRELSLNEEYPGNWGIWPAIILFLFFAWLENGYSESSLPSRVAFMAIAYSGITLGGMWMFGKHRWLSHGEAFSVVFGFFAKFAPTEVRTNGGWLCQECDLDCLDDDGECVDCYGCFSRALAGRPTGNRVAEASSQLSSQAAPRHLTAELNIRPYAVGLSRNEPVSQDVLVMVVLLLSTVTFDGLGATPAWERVQSWSLDIFAGSVNTVTVNGITIADTFGLVLTPVAFLAAYLIFTYMMSRFAGGDAKVMDLARAFVYSLIPIALAYNIAHFVNLLAVQGQLIIPLASDPFSYGWDLFGTAGYETSFGVIGAKALWFLSVATIVLGHVIAVYLAHRISLRIFTSRAMAIRSQYPMLALMVLYTVVSLWIIAQPIVD